jgi:hypothetical protein
MAVTAPTSLRIRRSPDADECAALRLPATAWTSAHPHWTTTKTTLGKCVYLSSLLTGSEMLFQKCEGALAMDGMTTVEVFDFGPVREAILLI